MSKVTLTKITWLLCIFFIKKIKKSTCGFMQVSLKSDLCLKMVFFKGVESVMAQMGLYMVCPEPAYHTSLQEAHGNVGAHFSTSVTNSIMVVLKPFGQGTRGDSGVCGRHQYFSASDDLFTSLFGLAVKLGPGLG